MGFPRHSLTPAELACILAAEREGDPFLAYRDGGGGLCVEPLADRARATIGRSDHNDIALGWDAEVSRSHAQLELVGGEWTVVDDGLSRNGSFVNAERVVGRRRLQDADVIRVGQTALVFRAPVAGGESTAVAREPPASVTPAERRVLVALCRPLLSGGAVPAGNQAIADELHLSLPGVKTHLQALFSKLDVDELPQYGKRSALAQKALAAGLVTTRDVSGGQAT